ncbi:sulfhydryl oxidase 1 [Salminus brasiliensis]|uniref:sulfhydryl oxidase 1 n=1 Tax=Salminus brasiliensis TaxID=930266 RepID=UPI003B838773
MARRCSATSLPEPRLRLSGWLLCALLAVLWSPAARAALYSPADRVLALDFSSVSQIFNTSSAFLLELYATWCGHCVAFAPVWKNLSRDISEWKPAVDLAVIDCANEDNKKVCTILGVTGYPTVKFIPAYASNESVGENLRGFPRDVKGLRHLIIDKLESHKEPGPPACPPLEPASAAEIDSFYENNNVQHLALVFEKADSYVGREVTLDLLQYENIAVRRVLDNESDLVSRFEVTEFPSCYLYYTHTNYSRLSVLREARTFYSYALQRLPGVVRAGKPRPAVTDLQRNRTEEPWRAFNRTRVYMSDLESALHYSLRVELSAHATISGEALTALKHYVSVLTKYFPGRPAVKGALKAVDNWLQEQKEAEIKYSDFRTTLDSTVLSGDAVLPAGVRWVGCQGSQPQYRGYPCAVWTLFHVLTVQAKASGSTDALEVLQSMRQYVSSFFGCRPCATHFESMAQESLNSVKTPATAVWWLWSRHNQVNNRLAGALSEDPHFPKVQWPTPEICPSCHDLKNGGEHSWSKDQVLDFLYDYFSAERILPDYLQEVSEAVAQQKALLKAAQKQNDTTRRRAREAQETPSAQPAQEEEEVVEEEEEEEEEGDEAAVAAEEEEPEAMGEAAEVGEPHPAAKKPVGETPSPERLSWARGRVPRRPGIVRMKLRQPQEDIVDLDSFINQHYKAKALRAVAMVRQRQDEAEERPSDSVRRVKRELFDQQEALLMEPYPPPQERRWMSLLSVGFSRLDVSLCVLFYLLSTLCLSAMYLYFKLKRRLRRAKVALP